MKSVSLDAVEQMYGNVIKLCARTNSQDVLKIQIVERCVEEDEDERKWVVVCDMYAFKEKIYTVRNYLTDSQALDYKLAATILARLESQYFSLLSKAKGEA